MSTEDSPPEGYAEPIEAWCVEYVDPRQPGEGSFQVGAFTTEAEAQKLRRRLEADGFFAKLQINLIPVHHRVEDWEWDR
ncbi:SPOR domain-containing protein [Actinopolymorpha sp. B9G3]|uniref:SPOR domain-containing protein n=1 Tax=Actinopolymorpha sp. B9G3 TaxID=3158970 RepID=UPI0032D96252